MVLVLGCAALGVDVGSIYADRRKAQSAADLAAIVAAGNLGKATSAAAATVMANGYPANALLSVELGTFTANAALTPQARFVTPATGAPNAARVTLRTETPLYFARMFTGGSSHFDITSRATAASTALASFAIGSRLVSLNGGLLNAMLGRMLGTTLSLSAMDYQALIDAHIDAFDFINALATRLDLTGVTYDSVLSGDVKVGDIVAAMLSAQQAANGLNAATTALSNVSLALAGLTTTIVPGKLIDVGPYAAMTVGSKPKTGVSVSAFDLLSATGAIANGSNQIAASVNLGLPGIASVSVMATIGEYPQGASWMTVGTEGVSVHTAQTRVLVSIKLLGSGPVAAVNLPVYVEVASGTATLNAVSCGRPDISTSSVTLGVTPGIRRRLDRQRVGGGDDQLHQQARSGSGDVGQSRRDHRDRPRSCRHGQHHADPGVLQLCGHCREDEEDRDHDRFHLVTDREPARRSLAQDQCGAVGPAHPRSRAGRDGHHQRGHGVDRSGAGAGFGDARHRHRAGGCLGLRHPLRRGGAGELNHVETETCPAWEKVGSTTLYRALGSAAQVTELPC